MPRTRPALYSHYVAGGDAPFSAVDRLQNTHNKKTKTTESMLTMTEVNAVTGDVAEPGLNASGALKSIRTTPFQGVPAAPAGSPSGVPALILRTSTGGELAIGPEYYTRCNAIIIDAMRILECLGYLPVLVRKSKIPLDLIAIRPDGALIIEVVRSRTPLPNAKVVCTQCEKEIGYLREMMPSSQFRKMLWVYSPQCRWRFYDVFPGGIWLAKDMMEGDGRK